VVAERDRIGSGGEQPVREPRRDPCAVGHVLAVEDAKAHPELLFQAGQAFLDRLAPGRAEDVGDEEDSYGTEAALALPPSARTGFPGGRLK
jgi:hypothetical protein